MVYAKELNLQLPGINHANPSGQGSFPQDCV